MILADRNLVYFLLDLGIMTTDDIKKQLDWVFSRNSDDKAIVKELAEGIRTRIFTGLDSMLSFVTIEPHTQGTIHNHPEEQWGILLEGRCIRIQGDIEIEMEVGDFWYSPPNVPHGIRTGEDPAVVVDIFSPPRSAYRATKSTD